MKKLRKPFAAFMLLIMTSELLAPNLAYALTSGPSQPEMKGFEPVGNSDMVDLFSGDFSYNIPLMDVGGYPVNLAYQSGSGADDEASWVGLGWSLSPGAVNRQLRGAADEFDGSDLQSRELSMKDHITKSGKFSANLDLLGIPVGGVKKKRKKKKLNLTLTVSAGVTVDNYRGVGVDIGANLGTTLTDAAAGDKTPGDLAYDSTTSSGMYGLPSVGLSLSSMNGAGTNVNFSVLRSHDSKLENTHSFSSSFGFNYNSRMGLTQMTLGNSYNPTRSYKDGKNISQAKSSGNWRHSGSVSFNSPPYTPSIDHPTTSNSFTFSANAGAEVFFAYVGVGIQGGYSRQTITNNLKVSPSYGFLNNHKGKGRRDALLDFNREKDIPYMPEVKYLPVPVPTYDLFQASSQAGGGQYRLYPGSSAIFFDQRVETNNNDYSLGLEVGGGAYFDVGADLFFQNNKTVTSKWEDRNNFLGKGDYPGGSTEPMFEPAYFKRVGEPVPYDNDYVRSIKGTGPVSVHLPANILNGIAGAEASDRLRTPSQLSGEETQELRRYKREVRNTTLSYLTAGEASHNGLEKFIVDHHPDSLVLSNCNPGGIRNNFARVTDKKKKHHFSEITITSDGGQRSVYGIPVYNNTQEEVSFSIGENLSMRNNGLIRYQDGVDNSTNNKKGLDHYYSKEIIPSYATSWLLTGILSPDYVDKTGNGITDDDLGTAVKFNYSRLANEFKWRSPMAFGKDTANYNEGFLSDPMDDKANFVYGTKEVWYMHSIESKTMIAHFITGDREDALGVKDSRGEIEPNTKMKYLREIRLYSKSDLRMNGNNPSLTIPIKVVHFEYDYSICRGLPNSNGNQGKLTLKKVYFTFGRNQKGILNPYEFKYDTTSHNQYGYRQYDRWGGFKNAGANPGGMNNSEYPYTLQNKTLADQYVAIGQLNEILLPSGGGIRIKYESDDYAYVQDRRASQMCSIQGVNTSGSSQNLITADYIFVDLPAPVNNRKEMLERYFEGMENLYFKALLDLDNLGHKEYVPGYARIIGTPELVGNNIAKIQLEKSEGTNPIAKAGWQFLRMNLPKYAYPGSDNLTDEGSDLKKSIQAMVSAFGTIKELFYGFNSRASNKNYSNKIDLSRSWVRLCSPEWKKLGGGSRVARIDISDDWAEMSGTAGAKTTAYSQVFDYTTTDPKGRTISSGVASYEPMIGNDENPFRQPLRYKQSKTLALDNYYYIEEPFAESLFPAASVGYSKVTVKSIGSEDAESVNRTGASINEFYTAKEFPLKVDVLGLQQRRPSSSKLFKLIGGVSYETVGLSQGYSIELNDMHGKPKATHISNKSGQAISSVEYFYQTENDLAERRILKNDVKVIDNAGIVSDGTIGMDVEMYTDMRQQTTENLGINVRVSGGSGSILIFPLPFFFPGIGVNYDVRNYRAASTIKIVQKFGVLSKVRKIVNGSSITSENLIWDSETGNVLLTKSQNEFDDPVYYFTYPAHWAYNGMGQAYQNLGSIFYDFEAEPVYGISSWLASMLFPGDELINLVDNQKYWVISSPLNNTTRMRLIDAQGQLATVSGGIMKLIRSGRRNQANMAVGSITSLSNPVTGNFLNVSQLTRVLDANASVFNEEWSVPSFCQDCPPGYTLSEDASYCYQETAPEVLGGCYTICEGSHSELYGTLGTYIYNNGYDMQGNGTVQYSLTSDFWTGKSCTPSSEAKGSAVQLKAPVLDSFSKKSMRSGMAPMAVGPNCNLTPQPRTDDWCGPLHRTSIWSCEGTNSGGERLPLDHWLGFSVCLNAPQSKTYYLGIASDNYYRFKVDGVLKMSKTSYTVNSFNRWFIYPIFLEAGQHFLEFEAMNEDLAAAFGAEVYDNTPAEIAAATSYDDLNVVFSTKDMIGQQFLLDRYKCPDGSALVPCKDPMVCRKIYQFNKVINPYVQGIKGNWRPQSQYAYHVSREQLKGDPNLHGGTEIRKSGAYSVFNPFWQPNWGGWDKNPSNDERWIQSGTVTHYNGKGEAAESRDALNRYTAAQFGYLESLPVAVSTNARYRETGFDGFEDYGFLLDCATGSCYNDHFSFRSQINGGTRALSKEQAHSGKYSLLVNGSAQMKKSVYQGEPASIYRFENGQYLLTTNEPGKGFSPIPGKKYLLSFWVKDGSPRNASTNVQALVNGSGLVNPASKWPVVEGWKRVEVPFVLAPLANEFRLELQSGGGPVYFDDIRILPYDAQLKSFAYDPSSQRLMAELDENNFATFYEYDDEGTLIRVKKETERGIMTLKENRSAYRKK